MRSTSYTGADGCGYIVASSTLWEAVEDTMAARAWCDKSSHDAIYVPRSGLVVAPRVVRLHYLAAGCPPDDSRNICDFHQNSHLLNRGSEYAVAVTLLDRANDVCGGRLSHRRWTRKHTHSRHPGAINCPITQADGQSTWKRTTLQLRIIAGQPSCFVLSANGRLG
jgi:hypothetical protein